MLFFLIYIENETKKREDSESKFVRTIENLMIKFRDEFRKERAEK